MAHEIKNTLYRIRGYSGVPHYVECESIEDLYNYIAIEWVIKGYPISSVNRMDADGSTPIAFEDNSYSGQGKIFFYKGKLWSKVKRNTCIEKDYGIKSALEDLIWVHENCSTYFRFHWDRENGFDTSRDAVIRAARNDMKGYILVNGELYGVTSEPRYVINTFGLGHNHGGTGMFVEYGYNPNIRNDNYFSALDGKAAVDYANKVAAGRGDTKDVGKFKEMIVVHMPELVKVKPKKQHGKGNKLLNDMEDVIQGVDDPFIAGLLCMSVAAHQTEV